MVLPRRLKELYAVAAKAAKHFSPPVDKQRRRVAKTPKVRLPKAEPLSAHDVFDRCGLILEIPPKAGYYWCTPEKALTFATTGGDGVHYSHLSSDELPPGVVPVVMTVPANFNDELNVVLAESIDEFLGLGYHVGWFALEQVVYDPEWAPDYFAQPDPDDDDEDKTARLEFLRSELGIKSVALSLKRIAKLTKRYASFLVVPDEPPD
jgi:hypothetical protein